VFYLARSRTPPRIDADVDEEDIALVKVGQQVLIHADAFPDKVFNGQVSEITPKGDPVARSYRVRIGLPADTPLMIGMTAETNIVIASRTHALLVPSTSLDGDHVWIVRDGHALPQRVGIGARGAERIEILNGISDSDTVVVQPASTLRVGQRVRATSANTSSAGASPSGPGT
jgi:RND family efflux transporter MFP subunit